MARLVDRLIEETRLLCQEAESEGEALLAETRSETYRRYLARWYGFIAPIERSLVEVDGLDRVIDRRRLRKATLIARDLVTTGLETSDVDLLPQCMSVPLFEDLRDGLGWAFLIERSTLSHPTLFRRLAAVIPGEVAFASSFLKCYSGAVGEMWQSFGDGLELAAREPGSEERITTAAKASYRHFRRWRATLDGKSLSVGGAPSTTSQAREPT